MKVLCNKCRNPLEWRYEIDSTDVILIESCPCQQIKCDRCKNIISTDTRKRPNCPDCDDGLIQRTFQEAYEQGYDAAKDRYMYKNFIKEMGEK